MMNVSSFSSRNEEDLALEDELLIAATPKKVGADE